jgi:hypothetical protein
VLFYINCSFQGNGIVTLRTPSRSAAVAANVIEYIYVPMRGGKKVTKEFAVDGFSLGALAIRHVFASALVYILNLAPRGKL